jgi:hypothetical protein
MFKMIKISIFYIYIVLMGINNVIIFVAILLIVFIIYVNQNEGFSEGSNNWRKVCPLDKDANAVDKYISEVVLSGKFVCTNEIKQYTRPQIQRYQNDFFTFDQKINRNSSGGVDMVDRVNQLYTENNNERIGEKGQTIADLFDKLTKN